MTSSMPLLFISLFLIIVFTRLLPYIFAERLKEAKMIESIGKQLPAYIMFLLLIYEIEIETFLHWPYGLFELAALLLLIIIHYWKRNLLLSLFVSSSFYLMLLHFL